MQQYMGNVHTDESKSNEIAYSIIFNMLTTYIHSVCSYGFDELYLLHLLV